MQPFAAQMHFPARLKASGRKLVLVTGRELPALVRRAERRTKNGPAVTR